MNNSRMRLSAILPALIVLIFLFSFGLLGFISSRLAQENIRQSIRVFSRPIVRASARSLFNPLYHLNVVQMNETLSQYVDDEAIIYAAVYNADGARVTNISSGRWEANAQTGAARALRSISENIQVEQEQDDYLILTSPIVAGRQVIGAVEFVFDEKKMRASLESTQAQIIYVTVGVMLGTTLLFFFITRVALLPLVYLAESAQRIGEGNLDAPIVVKGYYEIALLAKNLEAMRGELLKGYSNLQEAMSNLEMRVTERTATAESARREAESARVRLESEIWLANGQNQLADVMRGEQSAAQLAENIIAQLCKYLGAESGALFLLNDNALSLVGSYAFSGRAGFNGQIHLGEGLAGQAALDGKLLTWEKIDSSARVISTGLADFKPRNLLAFPFYANNKVIGVIELAVLFDFEEKHLTLLNRLSEIIGTGFITVQTRQRLMNLLAELQRQVD